MVPEQALLMLSSIETFREEFAEYVAEVEAKGQGLNDSLVIGQMSRMKIAATVPEMLNRKKEGSRMVTLTGDDRVYTGEPMGGKARCLRTLIPAKIMEGKKVVLLSDFVMMRDLLHAEFAHLNPTFMRSGNVQVKKKLLAKFRETDSPLLIAGPQQISRGIDLSCADVMISCDLMWKAADQSQSLARLMGATSRDRIIELYILNAENSIDEHIFKTYFGKIAGAEQAIDHRVITRTARDTNWKSFVDQIVVQEELIANFLRDTGGDEGILLPDFGDDGLMERAI
jgi:SNF2 family DNA or RNA helicase